ncbi:MAG: hypothetical protein JJU32_17060 [Phormidium sp. BM_Day4_Bin.17]|nr:hypothetical protein [Phormidium sp. BM_Day4_Bin.17]UCJ12650.1 MAG: hypothetical protein JWS08_02190 [Phormidium sp. PBR-2020]
MALSFVRSWPLAALVLSLASGCRATVMRSDSPDSPGSLAVSESFSQATPHSPSSSPVSESGSQTTSQSPRESSDAIASTVGQSLTPGTHCFEQK